MFVATASSSSGSRDPRSGTISRTRTGRPGTVAASSRPRAPSEVGVAVASPAIAPRRARGDEDGREGTVRSEEHTSELQSRQYLVCRLLLEKKKKKLTDTISNLLVAYPSVISSNAGRDRDIVERHLKFYVAF